MCAVSLLGFRRSVLIGFIANGCLIGVVSRGHLLMLHPNCSWDWLGGELGSVRATMTRDVLAGDHRLYDYGSRVLLVLDGV